MRFLIIIPAHNEEETLGHTLASLQRHQLSDFQLCVVDDGSQDTTFAVAEKFAGRDSRFSVIRKPSSAHSPGSKVVQAFDTGLNHFKIKDFDIICKFDADIIFPENYLSEVAALFQKNPTVGLVGGLVYIPEDKTKVNFNESLFDFKSKTGWQYEAISGKNHIRGPIKAYRTSAFLAMGGLRAVLGWDNLDEILLKKAGFTAQTLPNIWVKHLRPTGSIYRKDQLPKLGLYFRNLGLDLPLTLAAAGKEALRRHSFRAFFTIVQAYLKAPVLGHLMEDELHFIRKYRYRQLFQKFFRR